MERRFRKRKKEKKMTPRQNPFVVLANLLLVVATIVALLALIITLIAPYIAPARGGFLPILALIAPATYTTNLLLALYWIVRWRWRVATPTILVLIIGLSKCSLFMNIPLTKSYVEEIPRGAFKVMSYNVRGLMDERLKGKGEAFIEYFDQTSPSVICMQEYNNYLLPKIDMRAKKYNKLTESKLAIWSRYPIIGGGSLFKERKELKRSAMYADVVVGRDTIRIFNCHLASTSIKESDDKYITSTEIVRDSNRNDKIADIVARYIESCVKRSTEVEAISEVVAQSPYPTIICGDFNDTPASYAYSVMSRGMKDAFEECGKNYSYTYRGFLNMLRIDYILLGEGITPYSYDVDRQMTISDHLPVTSYIKID